MGKAVKWAGGEFLGNISGCALERNSSEGENWSARKLEVVLSCVKDWIWIGFALRPFLPARDLSDVSLMSGA